MRDPRRMGRESPVVLRHRAHLGHGKTAGDGGHDAIQAPAVGKRAKRIEKVGDTEPREPGIREMRPPLPLPSMAAGAGLDGPETTERKSRPQGRRTDRGVGRRRPP